MQTCSQTHSIKSDKVVLGQIFGMDSDFEITNARLQLNLSSELSVCILAMRF